MFIERAARRELRAASDGRGFRRARTPAPSPLTTHHSKPAPHRSGPAQRPPRRRSLPCTQSHRLNRGQGLATEFTRAQLQARKHDARASPPERGNYVAKNAFRDTTRRDKSTSRQNLPHEERQDNDLSALSSFALMSPCPTPRLRQNLLSFTRRPSCALGPLEYLKHLEHLEHLGNAFSQLPQNEVAHPDSMSLLSPLPPSPIRDLNPPLSPLCRVFIGTCVLVVCHSPPPVTLTPNSRSTRQAAAPPRLPCTSTAAPAYLTRQAACTALATALSVVTALPGGEAFVSNQ
jgi:hypothetical protein